MFCNIHNRNIAAFVSASEPASETTCELTDFPLAEMEEKILDY